METETMSMQANAKISARRRCFRWGIILRTTSASYGLPRYSSSQPSTPRLPRIMPRWPPMPEL